MNYFRRHRIVLTVLAALCSALIVMRFRHADTGKVASNSVISPDSIEASLEVPKGGFDIKSDKIIRIHLRNVSQDVVSVNQINNSDIYRTAGILKIDCVHDGKHLLAKDSGIYDFSTWVSSISPNGEDYFHVYLESLFRSVDLTKIGIYHITGEVSIYYNTQSNMDEKRSVKVPFDFDFSVK